jgi:hypothetical protein
MEYYLQTKNYVDRPTNGGESAFHHMPSFLCQTWKRKIDPNYMIEHRARLTSLDKDLVPVDSQKYNLVVKRNVSPKNWCMNDYHQDVLIFNGPKPFFVCRDSPDVSVPGLVRGKLEFASVNKSDERYIQYNFCTHPGSSVMFANLKSFAHTDA